MLNQKNVKLGIAPIGWTNDDLPELGGHISLEQCLNEMSEAGYTGCEVGNKYPRDPKKLKILLQPRQLKIASAWYSTFFTEEKKDETVNGFIVHMNFLKAMGAKVVVICECGYCIQGQAKPILGDKPEFSDYQWQLLIDGLHEIGHLAKKEGMAIVYHHHMGTGIQNWDEISQLMKRTDSSLVSLLADTGHMLYAGSDPMGLFTEFADRIRHIHLKDIRLDVFNQTRSQKLSFLKSVKRGVFTVPGDGVIDFAPVFKWVKESHYCGWLIVEAEQDPALANPLEYAKKARSYIKKFTDL
jgi:inosose dehydratase